MNSIVFGLKTKYHKIKRMSNSEFWIQNPNTKYLIEFFHFEFGFLFIIVKGAGDISMFFLIKTPKNNHG